MARLKKTTVQALLFSKDKWSKTKAIAWLKSHSYKSPTPEGKGDYHRFRQSPPFQFQKGSFRTIAFGKASNGIKAIIAIPRGETKLKRNPEKKSTPRKARVPSLMVGLADARSVELEDGREIKFPASGRFALCANKKGNELWILSRKGGKRVQAEDERAEKLFEEFTGFESENAGDLVITPSISLERIGRAQSIVYRSDKFSTKSSSYIHAFTNYPTVSVDNTNRPKIVALRGGKIRVTAEGIKG